MHGKNAIIKSSQVIESKMDTPPVSEIYLIEKVYLVVGLPEVVLDVVILGRDSQLDKLLLESAGLLKEAMYFSSNFHCYFLLNLLTLSKSDCRKPTLHPRSTFVILSLRTQSEMV